MTCVVVVLLVRLASLYHTHTHDVASQPHLTLDAHIVYTHTSGRGRGDYNNEEFTIKSVANEESEVEIESMSQ